MRKEKEQVGEGRTGEFLSPELFDEHFFVSQFPPHLLQRLQSLIASLSLTAILSGKHDIIRFVSIFSPLLSNLLARTQAAGLGNPAVWSSGKSIGRS
eukprot:356236-Hanusia_phi.AAC.1